MDAYEEGSCIGRGNYGSAHVFRHKRTNKKYVAKKVPVALLSDEERLQTDQVLKFVL
jgi:hypothetical protein